MLKFRGLSWVCVLGFVHCLILGIILGLGFGVLGLRVQEVKSLQILENLRAYPVGMGLMYRCYVEECRSLQYKQ